MATTIDKAYTLTMGGKTWALDCPKRTWSGNTSDYKYIDPNVYNVFGTIDGSLRIKKNSEKPDVVNVYIIRFTCGTNTSLEFSEWAVKWVNNKAPTFTEGLIVEITIIDNFALALVA
jgi:hypothetical protein